MADSLDVGQTDWLVFAYSVMLLVEKDPEPFVTHVYRRIFERPKHVTLQAAVRKTQDAYTQRYIAWRLRREPSVRRQVQQYASQLRDGQQRSDEDIQVVQDTGTRRPDVLPGLVRASGFDMF